jgi:hypothetical protein
LPNSGGITVTTNPEFAYGVSRRLVEAPFVQISFADSFDGNIVPPGHMQNENMSGPHCSHTPAAFFATSM